MLSGILALLRTWRKKNDMNPYIIVAPILKVVRNVILTFHFVLKWFRNQMIVCVRPKYHLLSFNE